MRRKWTDISGQITIEVQQRGKFWRTSGSICPMSLRCAIVDLYGLQPWWSHIPFCSRFIDRWFLVEVKFLSSGYVDPGQPYGDFPTPPEHEDIRVLDKVVITPNKGLGWDTQKASVVEGLYKHWIFELYADQVNAIDLGDHQDEPNQ